MRVSKVSYSRLKNLGNFQHEKVEVELELSEGDNPEDAMKACKGFVNSQLGLLPSKDQVEQAKKIVDDYDGQTSFLNLLESGD